MVDWKAEAKLAQAASDRMAGREAEADEEGSGGSMLYKISSTLTHALRRTCASRRGRFRSVGSPEYSMILLKHQQSLLYDATQYSSSVAGKSAACPASWSTFVSGLHLISVPVACSLCTDSRFSFREPETIARRPVLCRRGQEI